MPLAGLNWECLECGEEGFCSDTQQFPKSCSCGNIGLVILLPGVYKVSGEDVAAEEITKHMVIAEIEALNQYKEDQFLHNPKPDTDFDDYNPDDESYDEDDY